MSELFLGLDAVKERLTQAGLRSGDKALRSYRNTQPILPFQKIGGELKISESVFDEWLTALSRHKAKSFDNHSTGKGREQKGQAEKRPEARIKRGQTGRGKAGTFAKK